MGDRFRFKPRARWQRRCRRRRRRRRRRRSRARALDGDAVKLPPPPSPFTFFSGARARRRRSPPSPLPPAVVARCRHSYFVSIAVGTLACVCACDGGSSDGGSGDGALRFSTRAIVNKRRCSATTRVNDGDHSDVMSPPPYERRRWRIFTREFHISTSGDTPTAHVLRTSRAAQRHNLCRHARRPLRTARADLCEPRRGRLTSVIDTDETRFFRAADDERR